MQLVPSAGKSANAIIRRKIHTPSANAGKHALCIRKPCHRCQSQENAQPLRESLKHTKHRKAYDLCQARRKKCNLCKARENVQPMPHVVNIQPLPSTRKHATARNCYKVWKKHNPCQRGKKCNLRQAWQKYTADDKCKRTCTCARVNRVNFGLVVHFLSKERLLRE